MALRALSVAVGSDAVFPTYLIAMAGSGGRDLALVKRLRRITIGLLTRFYFVRASCFVSIPSVIMAPFGVIARLIVEIAAKVVSIYPTTRAFRPPPKDAMYATLLMASGLIFRAISAPFGLSNKIIDDGPYSALVAAIIGTAVLQTLIANRFHLPHHLPPADEAALHTPVLHTPMHEAEVEEALEDSEVRP